MYFELSSMEEAGMGSKYEGQFMVKIVRARFILQVFLTLIHFIRMGLSCLALRARFTLVKLT